MGHRQKILDESVDRFSSFFLGRELVLRARYYVHAPKRIGYLTF